MSMHHERLAGDEIIVPSRALSSVITREVDLLKMDIEGAETAVILELAASGKLKLIKQIHLEYHHHIWAKRITCRFSLAHWRIMALDIICQREPAAENYRKREPRKILLSILIASSNRVLPQRAYSTSQLRSPHVFRPECWEVEGEQIAGMANAERTYRR